MGYFFIIKSCLLVNQFWDGISSFNEINLNFLASLHQSTKPFEIQSNNDPSRDRVLLPLSSQEEKLGHRAVHLGRILIPNFELWMIVFVFGPFLMATGDGIEEKKGTDLPWARTCRRPRHGRRWAAGCPNESRAATAGWPRPPPAARRPPPASRRPPPVPRSPYPSASMGNSWDAATPARRHNRNDIIFHEHDFGNWLLRWSDEASLVTVLSR